MIRSACAALAASAPRPLPGGGHVQLPGEAFAARELLAGWIRCCWRGASSRRRGAGAAHGGGVLAGAGGHRHLARPQHTFEIATPATWSWSISGRWWAKDHPRSAAELGRSRHLRDLDMSTAPARPFRARRLEVILQRGGKPVSCAFDLVYSRCSTKDGEASRWWAFESPELAWPRQQAELGPTARRMIPRHARTRAAQSVGAQS